MLTRETPGIDRDRRDEGDRESVINDRATERYQDGADEDRLDGKNQKNESTNRSPSISLHTHRPKATTRLDDSDGNIPDRTDDQTDDDKGFDGEPIQ
jgi:hypothetical protein